MSRWLVTGAQGMLGTDLVAALEAAGEEVDGLGRSALDVRDPQAVNDAVRGLRPDLVVNCAGWTAVDDAESHEPEAARLNGDAPAHLALACGIAPQQPVLLQLSTDYVFAGTATTPYREDAPTAPVSAYGRTKRAGELAVRELLAERGTVVRTAWLYGAHGPNFVATMARLSTQRPTVEVVDDQTGQPTWTGDLAGQLVALGIALRAGTAPAGTYHATNAGSTTWYGFAREVFSLLGLDPGRVLPTSTHAFPRPAPRPAWSVLGHDGWAAAGLAPMRPWDEALRAAWPALGLSA